VLAILSGLAIDIFAFVRSMFVPRTALIAENLFLRKQLALYQEHDIKPAMGVYRLKESLGSRAIPFDTGLQPYYSCFSAPGRRYSSEKRSMNSVPAIARRLLSSDRPETQQS
jgi:hypothetical protein